MRVLVLNRCYYPDVEATGQLLAELCADLACVHEVTVIAGQPNFLHLPGRGGLIERDQHEGVQILRTRNLRFSKKSFLGRVVGLLSYVVLAAAASLVQPRPDLIIVETDPPVLGAIGVFLKWWHRCPLIYYLQDLFPEVGLIMGRLRPGLLSILLRWLTQLGLTRADRVVVLGDDMRRRVLQRGIAKGKIAVVPNWIDTDQVQPCKDDNPRRHEWGLQGQFAVVYSGNLGLSQNLEPVLAAAAALRGENVTFLLIGEGAAKARLMEQATAAGLDNVYFLPYQPKDRLAESLSAADLHLIPLRRGLAGCIVPSKLYGILASGTAYLAAVDADSEVARITREAQTGLLIAPDEAEPLIDALRWCLTHRGELTAMGQRGREVAVREFDRRRSVARFEEVIAAATLRTAPGRRPAPATPEPAVASV